MDKDNISLKNLSDITVFTKYAKYLDGEQRRETWEELVTRNFQMHEKKFKHLGDEFVNELAKVYSYVLEKKVLPSMRSAQFAGKAIELNNSRIFNCSYIPIEHPLAFSEIMFLLLGGSGVGLSVQQHHVNNLPEILGPNSKTRKYVIADSIIGWADSIKTLVSAYFYNKPSPKFDFGDIRPKGTSLKTAGGKAPGPQPLKDALHNIKKVFDLAIEERGFKTKLKPIEVHDISCYIAEAVLAGGIRRAACISLFSYDDKEMLSCKFGNWFDENPQRQRANNSVMLIRHKAKKKHFDYIWDRVKSSGFGEPGIIWSNDKNTGINPCAEISLKPYSFCNLTTINVSDINSQEELNDRVRAASFLGTLQASYTDFHYLRDIWKETSETDSLIGVSMTGIGSGKILDFNISEAADIVKKENERVAKLIGINKAARTTCIKPEGSASCVVGSSSGIHAWYGKYYVRRMRFGKDEPIYNYLKHAIPHLVEDDFYKPETQAVVSIPVKAPEGSIYRDENALDLLERVKKFHDEWIVGGHNKGDNTNNVSCTVSIKNNEWDVVGEWMWKNRNSYNGITVLPYDNTSYVQAPFEEITQEKYEELVQYVRNIDLSKVKEENDNTDLKGEVACAGGACEII